MKSRAREFIGLGWASHTTKGALGIPRGLSSISALGAAGLDVEAADAMTEAALQDKSK
jgi:hypothetical protein